MAKLKSKQVDKFLSAFLGLSGVTVTSASSVNVTSALTTLLASAGDQGIAVPLQQASSSQQGLITSGTTNKVEVWDTDNDRIVVAGNEVFGRLSFSTPNYLVSFYTEDNGVETLVPINQAVILAIPYRFSFESYPQDSSLIWRSLDLDGDKGAGNLGVEVDEVLTVTGNNTFAALAHSAIQTGTARMTVNGQTLYHGTHFTITGTAIAISGGQSTAIGFTIATTDYCVLTYRY